MRVTADMKVREVLKINEQMIEAFVWLGSEFERLRNPVLRKLMAGRVTVAQAARIGRVPLTEALYVLNLTAGEEEKRLAEELRRLASADFEYREENPPRKPRELLELRDDDPLVHFVDLLPKSALDEDPLPSIMHELRALRRDDEILLVRHPFDPIPLRDRLARRGFASWAEERRPHEWYIYFFHPHMSAGAVAYRPLQTEHKVRAMAARA